MQQSCYIPHYMYAPSALQTPGFTDKNQSEVHASLSRYGYDIHAGYAVSNHIALLGSWYWRHERQYDNQYYSTGLFQPSPLKIDSIRYLRNQLTFGLSYFTPLNLSDKKHFFFIMSAGYGAGHFGMYERARIKQHADDTSEQVYSFQYHAGIKDIFFSHLLCLIQNILKLFYLCGGAKLIFMTLIPPILLIRSTFQKTNFMDLRSPRLLYKSILIWIG
ncbi:MAG: hypothetical protein ACRDE2_01520 [Chitinophagaceae bacterium]